MLEYWIIEVILIKVILLNVKSFKMGVGDIRFFIKMKVNSLVGIISSQKKIFTMNFNADRKMFSNLCGIFCIFAFSETIVYF